MSTADGSIYEGILQGTRRWIRAATGMPLKQIIPAADNSPQPTLPYISVRIGSGDLAIGLDERIASINAQTGAPQVDVQGMRQATLTLNAYGRTSDNLLTKINLSLQMPSILDLLQDNQMSVRPIGPLLDLSVLEDDQIERRFAREFQVQYLLKSTEPEQLVEVQNIGFDVDMTSDAASAGGLPDFRIDITISC